MDFRFYATASGTKGELSDRRFVATAKVWHGRGAERRAVLANRAEGASRIFNVACDAFSWQALRATLAAEGTEQLVRVALDAARWCKRSGALMTNPKARFQIYILAQLHRA